MPSPSPLRTSVLLCVAAGGAAGALVRHLLTLALPADADGFPWVVFGINVLGSALLAALPVAAVVRDRPLLPPLLGSGVLGGFTTMSAYSEQSRALVSNGHAGLAAAYVVGTLAACLVAVAAVDQLSGPAQRAAFEAQGGDR